jgi:hypothetical protein
MLVRWWLVSGGCFDVCCQWIWVGIINVMGTDEEGL